MGFHIAELPYLPVSWKSTQQSLPAKTAKKEAVQFDQNACSSLKCVYHSEYYIFTVVQI